MPTVDKAMADNIVKYNGYYNGDTDNSLGDNPRCIEITEYDNNWGGKGYGLTFECQMNVYEPSDYIHNPRCYWKYKP